MWRKLIFFVIVLSAVQDLGHGRHISHSYLNELARLMEVVLDPVRSCTSGCCVEVLRRTEDGSTRTERVLLAIEEHVPSPDDPCDLYVCKESGLSRERLMKSGCKVITCPSGQVLLTFPDSCCPRCNAVDEPPANCTFSEWSGYGPCSVTCGGGLKVRRRRFLGVDNGASRVNCSGNLTETMSCSEDCCPVNCTHTWGEYDRCSVTCGGGTRTRRPIITRPAEHGGYCPGPETVPCNTDPCNCEWEWGEYGKCSKTCGEATRTRYPIITTPAGPRGYCPPHVINEEPQTEYCDLDPCPEPPCKYEWGEYGECSATCGGGTKTRRPIITYPRENCPGPETVPCNTDRCPQPNCEYEWGEYGKCSEPCGGGTKTRHPIITRSGENCPGPETVPCNTNPCPRKPCEFQWGKYGPCSVTCGGGTKTRHPIIKRPAQNGGFCPGPETVTCNTNRCPRSDCDISGKDTDEDGVSDDCDNCPTIKNPEQTDSNEDGFGDACDNTYPTGK